MKETIENLEDQGWRCGEKKLENWNGVKTGMWGLRHQEFVTGEASEKKYGMLLLKWLRIQGNVWEDEQYPSGRFEIRKRIT